MEQSFKWFGRVLPSELTEVKLVILSDLHYGNPYCSVKHFLRTVDFIKERENCYCLLNGDFCEAAIRTSKGEIYKQVGSPDDQKKQVTEWLLPIKDKILGSCTGNHERRIYEVAGTDISLDIAEKLEIPYRSDGMLFKLSFGSGNSRHSDSPYVFWTYISHGYGGARTRGAKAVKVERLSHWQMADIFCLHPSTKILRGDLVYTELGNIKIGDDVLGVSEYPDFNRCRRVLHTRVTRVDNRHADTLKVILEDGTELITTSEHPWLIKRRHDGRQLGGRWNWYRADNLWVGDKLLRVFPVWDSPDDWISGYIAGLLDGEGSIIIGDRRERFVNFAQNEGLVMSLFENYLLGHDISYRKYTREDGCSHLIIAKDAARLVGVTQPKRLAAKAYKLVEKALSKPTVVKIAEIQPFRRTEVITIGTDAHTFLAEGLATHNCMSHDHEVNVAPSVRFTADPRGTVNDDGFLTGVVREHRVMLVKTNAFVKFGGYAEMGGFSPSDLSTPIINLLTPDSPLWKECADKPEQGVKILV